MYHFNVKSLKKKISPGLFIIALLTGITFLTLSVLICWFLWIFFFVLCRWQSGYISYQTIYSLAYFWIKYLIKKKQFERNVLRTYVVCSLVKEERFVISRLHAFQIMKVEKVWPIISILRLIYSTERWGNIKTKS